VSTPTRNPRIRVAFYGRLNWRTEVKDDLGHWDITGPPYATRDEALLQVDAVERTHFGQPIGDGAIWGAPAGVTWDNAEGRVKESFAMVRLFWFYRMTVNGGPDGTELDALVADEAKEAADWLGPVLKARAEAAGS
jgi:hypothetical protein